MRRLKILLSAYACEPGKGSEPAVGWHTARELASHHEVWVLTRVNNRPGIEAELARNPVPDLHFSYYDLPRWARWWKRGRRGLQLYYYLWQFGAYRKARRLHREIGFDQAQHVTFVVHWKPSLLALLPVPFVWGPVGGGDSAPRAFWRSLGLRGMIYEAAREAARWVGEHDPLVRATARRSVRVLAATEETARRVRNLGTRDVQVISQVGLAAGEIERLSHHGEPHDAGSIRFVSVGNLLHLKGFHLGLRAFARANLADARYWFVGDGSERKRLQVLARELGIAHQVKFWGKLPRDEALLRMGECHVLVHPSLHESGGWVCVEAQALGRPVICMDLGGTAVQVTEETGVKVPAIGERQAVDDMAEAMRSLSENAELRVRMGEAGRRRAIEHFNWREKGSYLAELHRQVSLDE